MPRKSGSTIYVAKDSFLTIVDGVEVMISKGKTRVREGHPLLNGRSELFEPLTVDYDIEQATAAPGEKRK
jgi:hypothetical protein